MHPQAEGGPDWPVPGGGAGRVARQGLTAGPLTPCSPGARVQAVQGPGWSAGAGLWGGPDAGEVQAGSGAEEVWAEPGEGGARDVAIVCQEREGAGGARTVADGCGNVLAMLYGMRAMSLVAHPRC